MVSSQWCDEIYLGYCRQCVWAASWVSYCMWLLQNKVWTESHASKICKAWSISGARVFKCNVCDSTQKLGNVLLCQEVIIALSCVCRSSSDEVLIVGQQFPLRMAAQQMFWGCFLHSDCPSRHMWRDCCKEADQSRGRSHLWQTHSKLSNSTRSKFRSMPSISPSKD